MKFEDAMKTFGFQPGYKPGKDEVKKVYRELALAFHPDRNAESEERMKGVNEAVLILRDVFDKKNEWKVEGYIYKSEPGMDSARFSGYEGYIDLATSGATLYRINRILEGEDVEDPSTIGMIANRDLPSREGDWYIEIDDFTHGFNIDTVFEIGLEDFVRGISEAKSDSSKRYEDDYWSVEIKDDGVNLRYDFLDKVTAENEERETLFEISDIQLFERIALGTSIRDEAVPVSTIEEKQGHKPT